MNDHFVTATPWQLLRQGKIDEAIDLMRVSHTRNKAPSYVMDLGIAYLWVEDYCAAWKHFNNVNSEDPNRHAAFYQMAGTAKWCLDEYGNAVAQWNAARRCQFADGAGGVRSALLLFIASMLSPKDFDRSMAEMTLTERVNDARVRNWPGAVAQFVLGRIDEAELRQHCVGVNERDTFMRHWLADFYIGVSELSRGDHTRFFDAAKNTSKITDDDFDRTKKCYLGKLWHEEFFIARHEVGKRAGRSQNLQKPDDDNW